MTTFERDLSSPNPGQVSHDTVHDQRRREAMLRMAKYAAPAMLALLIAEKAVAQSAP